jgi:transposase
LLLAFLDDYLAEDNPVRAIDVFIDELDLRALGFEGVVPEAMDRPAYHLATIYVYGYIDQVQSSRRLERETARNVEMMWLTGRLTRDFKTIADFRNGPAIRSACRQFVALCRGLNPFTQAIIAIDGIRFKAVNSRDTSFSCGSIKRRIEQVEASIERYLSMRLPRWLAQSRLPTELLPRRRLRRLRPNSLPAPPDHCDVLRSRRLDHVAGES